MEPIYRSDGEWVGVYHAGHLFNADGEWLGFLKGREVYDTGGSYLGFLSNDRRLLRRRQEVIKPRLNPPSRPPRPRIPANMPLSPMLPALPYEYMDLFEEIPERLIFISDTRPDMD
jgi:hypothetical protein